jgi:hypothetical protein
METVSVLNSIFSNVSDNLANSLRTELAKDDSFAKLFEDASSELGAPANQMATPSLAVMPQLETDDLVSLQRSLMNSYSVQENENGNFNVLYPTGGIIGSYTTEALAQRMARTFEAGKASMIYSANFKINRTEEVEGELREQGLSSVQIDAAFLKQKQNQEKAQSTLEAMVAMELSKTDDAAK